MHICLMMGYVALRRWLYAHCCALAIIMGNAPVAGCHSDDDVALPSSTSTLYQQKPGSRPVDDVTDDGT